MEWECLSMETRQEQINRILKRQLSGEVQSFIEQVEKVGIELSKLYRDWETDRKSTRLNSSHRL